MRTWGNKRRLCINGWVLSALVLLLLNLYPLMDMESQPWAGEAPEVKSLRSKLDRLSPAQAKNRVDRDEILPPISNPGPAGTTLVPDAGLTGLVRSVTDAAAFSLPVLTGIVEVLDPTRLPRYRAVLDGQVYEKSDRISGFWIGEITPRGVNLHYPGGKAFLPNPAPLFSSDQGG